MASAVAVPLVFSTRTDDVFYLPKLVGLWLVLLAAAWLVALSPRQSFKAVAAVDAAVAAFLGWHVVALALSTDRHQSLFGERLQHQGVLTLVLYVGFFFLARLAIAQPRHLWWLLRGVVVGAVAVSAYAIGQRVGIDPVWHGWLPAGRVFSTIGQPNALAAYLLLALPAAVVLAARAGKGLRAAYAAGALAMLAALAFTQSRGGYLAALVVAAVLAVGLRGTITRRAAATAAVGLLLAVPLLQPVAAEAWHRAMTTSQGTGDLSIRNHLETWEVAARIVGDHPLAGTGPETFPDQFPRYSRLVLSPDRVAWFDQFRVESPHNRYLAAAVDAGLPGALAYLAVLVALGLVLLRGIRRAEAPEVRLGLVAVAAALAGHVVVDGFMSAEVVSTWLFWVLAGAGVALAAAATPSHPKRFYGIAAAMPQFRSHVRMEAPREVEAAAMMRARMSETSASVSVRS